MQRGSIERDTPEARLVLASQNPLALRRALQDIKLSRAYLPTGNILGSWLITALPVRGDQLKSPDLRIRPKRSLVRQISHSMVQSHPKEGNDPDAFQASEYDQVYALQLAAGPCLAPLFVTALVAMVTAIVLFLRY